jgi:hypothetical protein
VCMLVIPATPSARVGTQRVETLMALTIRDATGTGNNFVP